ncbi:MULTISPECIES: hypothetical protein [Inquilinus]|uniref:Holin n=1 Tax=Inquilinus ginsengisoli TaxID=363840 RepID=A0ABU1JMZ1_9PROT|nr:hypothetical protein [Inquilinus ginsengisoli]MDR6289981.1 hypothetical protein [Inquilinus ginsengisoli]
MADPVAPDPGPLALLAPLIGPVLSAGIGVFMRHAHDAVTGKPFSLRRLVFEIPSMLGFGVMGGAVGSYLGAPEIVQWGVATLLGSLGTQGVDAVIARYLRGKTGGG